MKRLFLICCLCSLGILLFGFPIYEQDILTAETAPQKLPGTPNNYTSKAEWLDRRAGSLNNNGAFIEVFNNSTDCKARKEKIDQMYSVICNRTFFVTLIGRS